MLNCLEQKVAFKPGEQHYNSCLTSYVGSTDDVTDVYPDCPSPVQKYAFRCFTSYNTHMLNMMKSSATLFSGVDVEILRGFCRYLSLSVCPSVCLCHSVCLCLCLCLSLSLSLSLHVKQARDRVPSKRGEGTVRSVTSQPFPPNLLVLEFPHRFFSSTACFFKSYRPLGSNFIALIR